MTHHLINRYHYSLVMVIGHNLLHTTKFKIIMKDSKTTKRLNSFITFTVQNFSRYNEFDNLPFLKCETLTFQQRKNVLRSIELETWLIAYCTSCNCSRRHELNCIFCSSHRTKHFQVQRN